MFESFGGVDGGGPVRPPVPPEAAAEAERRLRLALELPPGAEAIAALAEVDAGALDGYDAVDLLVALERCSRWLAARQARAVVAVAGDRPQDRDDFARERVRVALRGAGGSAKANVDVARDVCGRLSQAGEALERGDLSYDHVRALTAETLLCDEATASEVAAAVLDAAGFRSTPAEFRRRVRAAVIAADPARAEQLARQAGRRRQVSKWVERDAQASLLFTGPAIAVQLVWTALDLHAATAPPWADEAGMVADGAQEPPRTLDQRRFDALVDISRHFLAGHYGPAVGIPDDTRAADPTDAVDPTDVADPADATAATDPAHTADPTGSAGAEDAPAGDAGAAAHAGGSAGPGAGAPAGAGVDAGAGAGAGPGLGAASIGTGAGQSCDCGAARPNRAQRRTRAGTSRRAGVRPQVFLYADAATWAGLTHAPVHLDGYGPIPAGIARDHFQTSQWRAVVTDTITRQAVAVSDTTYTPSARTRRHLHVRDRTCGFPGCGAAVWFCDIDHNTPHHQGGCTDTHNCGLFCRRHHRLKTFTPWTWAREPDGTLAWTDPDGHLWDRDPIRYPMPRPPGPAREADGPGDRASQTGPPQNATAGPPIDDDVRGTDRPRDRNEPGAEPSQEQDLRGTDPPPYDPADDIPPF